MPRQSRSTEFSRLYDSLPAGAQRNIVEKQLIPLLDQIQKKKAEKILLRTTRAVHAHRNVPNIDLQAKKIEVNGLLDELSKDSKCSFVKDRSNRETLLSEVVESIAEWLNDIWSLVFEYGLDFTRGHSALLFSIGVLDHVKTVRGGCKCSFSTMYVPVTFKKKTGKLVKTFSETGLGNVESAILWVWRELFFSLLASNNDALTKLVPDLLSDIDDIVGWQGLERVLCGGRRYAPADGEEHDVNEDDEYEDDEDEDGDDGDEESMFFADHWTQRIELQTFPFRQLIFNRMMAIFKSAPSFPLYSSLLTLGASFVATKAELIDTLSSIATVSSSSLAAALEIYCYQGYTGTISSLLDTHAHLLRPRDAPQLQMAGKMLALFPEHHARALALVEKELLSCARAIHAALAAPFSELHTPAQAAGLAQISTLRNGSAARQDAVERWVDAATTPGTAPANPMAFAAMMMGFPLGPHADPDDADPMGFLDLDPHDPDYADLREEFRPGLKQRFEGWSDTAEAISGGQGTLLKFYKELMEMMPFLGLNDIVEEMIGRLADKPSKHHVCDALDMLSTFVKTQKKRISAALKHRKTKEVASKASTSASASDSGGSGSAPVIDWMEEQD